MEQAELKPLLHKLIAEWESEVVEFKEANDNYPTSDIGKYFSALANEANLRGKEQGWLIFGVRNNDRAVTGTDYRMEFERLQSLKQQISQSTQPNTTFRDIHVLDHDGARVLLLEVPAAPRGIPISWNGAWFGRSGESINPLQLNKLETIRAQSVASGDWTAQFVDGASIADLDSEAVSRARQEFARRHANRIPSEDISSWPLETFLERAKMTRDGKITRTAILLLGRATSAHLLNPHPAELVWKLEGQEQANEVFRTPFFLTTSQIYNRIRNVQIRLLPENELIAHEVSKYDQKVILEALHNCVAHQDYARNARIVVTELPDRVLFENAGGFFVGSPYEYLVHHKTPLEYRNTFLVQAMAELGMIDRMGYGIRQMHEAQRKRFFPMPEYALGEKTVQMTVYGRVIDLAYSRLLMKNTSLPIVDVLALDRVQKGLEVSPDAVKRLKRSSLIEGRKPNYRVSAAVADATASRADYIRNRPFHDDFYAEKIIEFLSTYGTASRQDIDNLLLTLLHTTLTDGQKLQKISNLLSNLRRAGRIVNAGPRKTPLWRLA